MTERQPTKTVSPETRRAYGSVVSVPLAETAGALFPTLRLGCEPAYRAAAAHPVSPYPHFREALARRGSLGKRQGAAKMASSPLKRLVPTLGIEPRTY